MFTQSLEKLFDTVIVPNAVFEELISNSNYLLEAQMVVECPFLKRLEVSDRQSIKILREVVGLDARESEAIVTGRNPLPFLEQLEFSCYTPTAKQKAAIEVTAQKILDVRAEFADSILVDNSEQGLLAVNSSRCSRQRSRPDHHLKAMFTSAFHFVKR